MSTGADPTAAWEECLGQLVELSGHDAEDFEVLRRFSPQTSPWVTGAVAGFYDTLFGYPSSRAVFSESERLDREKTLRAWLEEVLSGEPGDDFWKRQWIVGLVHIERHVRPAFMLAMTGYLQQSFLEHCLSVLEPADSRRVFQAFRRVSDIVAAVAIESQLRGYVDAVGEVTGMKAKLIDRMADVAVDRLIARARSGG